MIGSVKMQILFRRKSLTVSVINHSGTCYGMAQYARWLIPRYFA